jgi:hypothetical protein
MKSLADGDTICFKYETKPELTSDKLDMLNDSKIVREHP